MSKLFVVLIAVAVFIVLVFMLVLRGKRRRKQCMELLAAFEREHGLNGSTRTVDGASRYLATGTVSGIELTIESELVRGVRGRRYVTRVSGKAATEHGSLLVFRRTRHEQNPTEAISMPEQRLDDQAFEDLFRTFGESVEQMRAVLTPELRQRLVDRVRAMTLGLHSLKVAGSDVTITIGWTLAFGLHPKRRAEVEEALDLVVSLCGAA